MYKSQITKPMLAVNADIPNLNYSGGLYCTVKLDGIRCLIVDGKAVSRNFKPIPNHKIREAIEAIGINDLDGEIIIEKDGEPVIFNEISGYVMSHSKELPEGYSLRYYVFDYIAPENSLTSAYLTRIESLKELAVDPIVKKVLPIRVNNFEELEALYGKALAAGFEGLIMRSGLSPYKLGRSTFKEGFLLKMKPFDDAEAIIVDLIEGQMNENEKTENAFGDSVRCSKKENMTDMDTLGAFKVKDMVSGLEFKIGTGIGLTKELRKEIWMDKKNMIGKIVKYRSQSVGVKELPRFPSFIGFRSEGDMS